MKIRKPPNFKIDFRFLDSLQYYDFINFENAFLEEMAENMVKPDSKIPNDHKKRNKNREFNK